jgi:hypothetical protein
LFIDVGGDRDALLVEELGILVEIEMFPNCRSRTTILALQFKTVGLR